MNIDHIIKLRQDLHSRPELSNEEYGTADAIKEFVATYNPSEVLEEIGGTGLAVIYRHQRAGKTIVIRCELDALPISESNNIPHKSKFEGVSHKCGHDGHMAIVAGLASWLEKKEFGRGTVVLLFQPAEETGDGAARILGDNRFKELYPDYVFALHNIPKEPLHKIIISKAGFSAEVQSMELILMGKEAHAAQPEHGVNPAICIAQIIQSISELDQSDPEDSSFAVLTPVHICMGKRAYGISPANGELHYTIRSWHRECMQQLKPEIEKICQQSCIAHNLRYKLNWFEYFPASINNEFGLDIIRQAASENNYRIEEKAHPFRFGEDFGWYSRAYKSAMFGIGAGINTPALHHNDYDFPDEIIETGLNMFRSIILNVLKDPD